MDTTPLKPPESFDMSQRSKPGMRPYMVIVLLFLLLLAGIAGTLFYRFTHMPQQQFPSEIPVKTAVVSAASLPVFYDTVGTLEANRVVGLKPEVAGIVRRLLFKEGQWVRKGQVLLELEHEKQSSVVAESESGLLQTEANLSSLRAEVQRAVEVVRQAQVKRDLAEKEYSRYQNLWAKEYVSTQELDQRKAQLDLAAAELTSAIKARESAEERLRQAHAEVGAAKARYHHSQYSLADTLVKAPFSGRIGIKQIELGDFVLPAQTLVTLVDANPMKVTFGVPERYATYLKTGLKVELKTESAPNRTLNGSLYFVDPVVSSETRTITVKALVDNRDNLLYPGQYANIRLILGQKENALLAPEESLIPQGEHYYVYAVEQGKAAFRRVRVGLRLPGQAEILSGIKPGTQVIVGGIQKVQDGMPVTPVSRETPEESRQAFESFKQEQQ